MKIEPTPIPGIMVITIDLYHDNRGFFTERYNEKKFKEAGLPTNFVQDNHSKSTPRVTRGLHFQHNPAQGKLVGATHGSVWDVGVDIRPNSPTLGKYFGTELSATNGKLLWLPPGIAHGFCVLDDEMADVLYKTTALFNPAGESGIAWDDPDLNIDWPIKDPIVSERDKKLQSFKDYLNNAPKW